ncbi:MAG: hypothetical protein OEM18_04540 [Nitrosopumilus sp.]|jgi:hypothetical protein|nr:hypothetical protein [Nitrosopumilus sp.]MDH3501908.1 hypothetical protein [Nitrosopumilus sp.]
MTILTEKAIEEILCYLERVIANLAKEIIKNSEFQNDFQELENFLSNQFDIRLENLLRFKDSSIHHLESGMKNRMIQRKKELLGEIKNQIEG